MPNGGLPMHMVLRPKSNPDVVIRCDAGRLRVDFHAQTRETSDGNSRSGFELSEEEAGALAWFLHHWVAPEHFQPAYKTRRVDAVFDYCERLLAVLRRTAYFHDGLQPGSLPLSHPRRFLAIAGRVTNAAKPLIQSCDLAARRRFSPAGPFCFPYLKQPQFAVDTTSRFDGQLVARR